MPVHPGPHVGWVPCMKLVYTALLDSCPLLGQALPHCIGSVRLPTYLDAGSPPERFTASFTATKLASSLPFQGSEVAPT